MNNKGRGD